MAFVQSLAKGYAIRGGDVTDYSRRSRLLLLVKMER
jgi:hypothetical protein